MSVIVTEGKSFQPLEQEKDAFAALLASLNSQEQATAKLSSNFSDVLLGPGNDGQFPANKMGIQISSLSLAKQKLVMDCIKRYVNDLEPESAKVVLAKYIKELPDTYLAYTGSKTMMTAGDYVRLDGPGLWMEYSVQPSRDFPGTVHPHSVWRDHNSDYGGN